MTTTLRPTGPLAQTTDGGRERAYQICVNGRPVGEVRLVADPSLGWRAGRVDRLRVDEGERRRGRATVALLAAEEVLRDWGCRRVELRVPAGSDAALGLGAALGYAERTRLMVKTVSGPAPLPPEGSRMRAPTEEEYAAWFAAERAWYLRGAASQGVPDDEAVAGAEATYRRLLPDGPRTAGLRLRVLVLAGTRIGSLWLSLGGDRLPSGMDAYVYAVEVTEEHRGRGHGRALMREADRLCHEAGARRLGLTVYAGNEPALSLYRFLGYRVRDVYLSKPLP
ncbi:GNAT family N-acetyltransferase [Streptomyces sp. 6N223]|uniref:GNAT family N-acetyltransferase n=1 Tax=Streptomyces sp. 6N223 TaxID=3457412 RepID=UPI003FD1429D